MEKLKKYQFVQNVYVLEKLKELKIIYKKQYIRILVLIYCFSFIHFLSCTKSVLNQNFF